MAFVVSAVAAAVGVEAAAAVTLLTEVSVGLTVVGAITGNRDLMKIGGVLGLAGGLTSIASGTALATAGTEVGASLSGETAALNSGLAPMSDMVSESASNIANGISSETAPALSSAAGSTGGAAMSSNAIDNLAPQTASATPGISTTPSLQNPTDMRLDAGTQMSPGSSTLNSAGTGGTSQAGAQMSSGSSSMQMVNGDVNPTDMRLSAGTQVSPGGASGSLFDSFQTWVKNNPKLAEIGMQTIGGAFKGLSDYQLAQQKLAQNQQMINLQSYGNQVANWAGVKPPSATPGIISGAMR